MLDDAKLDRVLSGITSSDPRRRDERSEGVVDLVKGFDADQANRVAAALARAALSESDPTSREAELNALTELTTYHVIDRTTVASVLELDNLELGPCVQEAIDDLREYAASDW